MHTVTVNSLLYALHTIVHKQMLHGLLFRGQRTPEEEIKNQGVFTSKIGIGLCLVAFVDLYNFSLQIAK